MYKSKIGIMTFVAIHFSMTPVLATTSKMNSTNTLKAAVEFRMELRQVRTTMQLAKMVEAKSNAPVAVELAAELKKLPEQKFSIDSTGFPLIKLRHGSTIIPVLLGQENDQDQQVMIFNKPIAIDWNGDFKTEMDRLAALFPKSDAKSTSLLLRLSVPEAKALGYVPIVLIGGGLILAGQQYMKCNAVTGALAHCEKQKANAQANLESMVDRERPEKYRAGLIASGFICSKSTALRKCVVDRGFDPKELESGSASSSTKPTGGPSDKTAQ